jgi:uncharacterized protein YlxP (DUF503 family)
MVTGTCKMVIRINGSFSLKDKRRTLKSLLERLKSQFNVSAAEVGKNDKWSRAVIGVACISNDASHTDAMLQSIINFIDSDTRIEIINFVTEKIYSD